ncbi:AAA family ATPase [Paraglaciecola aestuariivivens]
MPQSYPLSHSFFGGAKVICRDMPIDAEILEHEDVLLPFYCLLIENQVSGTELENNIVKCQYLKTDDGLLHVQAKNFELIDSKVADKILSEFTELALSKNLIERKPTGEFDITNIVVHFRKRLKSTPDNTYVDAADIFELVTERIPSFESDYYQDVDHNQPIKVGEEERLPPFSLSGIFSQQNADVTAFFEEVAILQAALHLNDFPEKHISNLTAKDLPKVTVDSIFHASLGVPEALACLANFCQILPYQVKMLPSTLQVRSILNEVVDKRTSQISEQGSKSWYCYARKKASQLTFDHKLSQLLSKSCLNGQIDLSLFFMRLLNSFHPRVEEFCNANANPVKALQLARASKTLKKQLSTKVVGQDCAINSVAKGFLASTLKAGQGPRLIYTFVGPSGVGKTYLASLFANYLNEIEGTDYQFSSYNMESYVDEKDAMRLFGSGNQYVDSALGTLTTSVRNYPRQVILFDEIEKAHTSVVSSLLSLLDSGVVKDNTLQSPVDFSQCIVVFTSNLGQETFLKNKTQQTLNVFEVLKTAKNPDTGVGFSPELVNRLAKGFPIIFNSLKINHLIRLAEKEVLAPANLNGVNFTLAPEFSAFLLQSISPDISVRRLQSAIAKFQAEALLKAEEYLEDEISDICIKVKLADEFQSKDNHIKVLFLDDDHKLIDTKKRFNLGQSATEFAGVSVSHCHNIKEFESHLTQQNPDAVLLDLEVINSAASLQNTIQRIIDCNPGIAIFTYVVDEQKNVSDICSINNELREHFVLSPQNEAKPQLENLVERVRYYLVTERQVRKLSKRHQALTYSLDAHKSDSGLVLTINNFNHQQMVFSEDLTNTDFFDFSLPDIGLQDVIGLSRAKKRLTEVIGWMNQPSKLAAMQVDMPTGFLFAGPPGTGKTLLAKALAGECQLPFFNVSAADLSSQYKGGTTQNIRQLFSTARKYAPAIIFIDEIDAIGRKRSQKDQGDGNLVVNTLLTEMDGFNQSDEPVFVLAATNYPEALDSALTRPGRFDETIVCDLPNKAARQQFFDLFINKQNITWPKSDIAKLVSRTQGLSSAEIEQILRESVYQAVSDNQSISVEHVNESINRISYGLPSDKVIMSDEEKKRTAYHETGHLLAYKLLFPNLPVDFITIIPRDQSLGFVATGRPDKYNGNTRVTIGHHLQVLLAGRVAEKILTGGDDFVSTGASSDIEKATYMAMSAIYEGGLSDDIGAVNLSLLTKFEESDLLHTAQQNVRKWIFESEKLAEKLLLDNFELFEHFAQVLLQKESMHGEQIDEVIKNFEQPSNIQSC